MIWATDDLANGDKNFKSVLWFAQLHFSAVDFVVTGHMSIIWKKLEMISFGQYMEAMNIVLCLISPGANKNLPWKSGKDELLD